MVLYPKIGGWVGASIGLNFSAKQHVLARPGKQTIGCSVT
jgi:hypothetical protein